MSKLPMKDSIVSQSLHLQQVWGISPAILINKIKIATFWYPICSGSSGYIFLQCVMGTGSMGIMYPNISKKSYQVSEISNINIKCSFD